MANIVFAKYIDLSVVMLLCNFFIKEALIAKDTKVNTSIYVPRFLHKAQFTESASSCASTESASNLHSLSILYLHSLLTSLCCQYRHSPCSSSTVLLLRHTPSLSSKLYSRTQKIPHTD